MEFNQANDVPAWTSSAGVRSIKPHFGTDRRRSRWSFDLRMRLQSAEQRRALPLFQLEGDCEVMTPHTIQGPENLRMPALELFMPHQAIAFSGTIPSGRNSGRKCEA